MSDTICPHGDLFESCIDCTVAPPKPQAVAPVEAPVAEVLLLKLAERHPTLTPAQLVKSLKEARSYGGVA